MPGSKLYVGDGSGGDDVDELCDRSMDDANDRGDVAPPAIHMPRSMSSRCMSCGKDLSTHDLKLGSGTYCAEHAATGDANDQPRPGGGATAPREPMKKGLVALTPHAIGKVNAIYRKIPVFTGHLPKAAKK